jgi:hypothetical protein
MDDENPLPPWARQILIGIGLFILGAVFAFGYSYRPLHGALSWKVDELETRLDERNREIVQLRDQLAVLESNDESRIDPETLAQVKKELEQTQRVLTKTEKDLDKIDRQRRDASSSASTWRKRFEELRDAPAPVPIPAATRPGPAPIDPATASDQAFPPAAPGPPSFESNPTLPRSGSPAAEERGMFVPDGSTTTAP